MPYFIRFLVRLLPPPRPALPAEFRPQQLPHPAQAGLLAALLYLR